MSAEPHITHEVALLLASLGTTLQLCLESRKRSQQAAEPVVPPVEQRPTDRPAMLDEPTVETVSPVGHRTPAP